MIELSLIHVVIIVIAGVITGIVNGVIGGGSLISYLSLTMLGMPPALAASTNTFGVITGNPAALITPYRRGHIQFRDWNKYAVVTAVGSVVGGALLVSLPERLFEFLIPVLLVIAGVSVWLQPHQDSRSTPYLKPLLIGSGIYNGYFGPGQGVLLLSILQRGTDLDVSSRIILKNYILTVSNISVSIVFILANRVVWSLIPLLWISIGIGGWLSTGVSQWVNERFLKLALTLLAGSSALYFWIWF